jgi:hypothetical protein
VDENAQHGAVTLFPGTAQGVHGEKLVVAWVADEVVTRVAATRVRGVNDGADAGPSGVPGRKVMDGEDFGVVWLVASGHLGLSKSAPDIFDALANVGNEKLECFSFGDLAVAPQVKECLLLGRQGQQWRVEESTADHFVDAEHLDIASGDAFELALVDVESDLFLKENVLHPPLGVRPASGRRRRQLCDDVAGKVVEAASVRQRRRDEFGCQLLPPSVDHTLPVAQFDQGEGNRSTERVRLHTLQVCQQPGFSGGTIPGRAEERIVDKGLHRSAAAQGKICKLFLHALRLRRK